MPRSTGRVRRSSGIIGGCTNTRSRSVRPSFASARARGRAKAPLRPLERTARTSILGGWPNRALRHSARRTLPVGEGTMLHGIYQMTPRQFRKAIDAGVFGENRVELLGGVPFVMAENPPHIQVC